MKIISKIINMFFYGLSWIGKKIDYMFEPIPIPKKNIYNMTKTIEQIPSGMPRQKEVPNGFTIFDNPEPLSVQLQKLFDLPEEVNTYACQKNLIFRGYQSEYLTKRGNIEMRQGFRLLKRQSCTGSCSQHDWIFDEIQEGIQDGLIIFPKEIQDGALYQLKIHWGSNFPEDDGIYPETIEFELLPKNWENKQ